MNSAIGTGIEGFYTVDEARKAYDLHELGPLLASDLDKQLYEDSIAQIEMPISDGDFETLIGAYETCIVNVPHQLQGTYLKVDARHGNEAGQVRKEAKISTDDGLQYQDAKNLFHFNEKARKRWEEQFKNCPAELALFLKYGHEVHAALIRVAKQQFKEIEGTHPNISKAYFPLEDGLHRSFSFMRVLSYDEYEAGLRVGDVAKPHTDIGGMTIQAYADAPGFWGSRDGVLGDRTYYNSAQGQAQIFMGQGHEKLYGENTHIKALAHGVGRIVSDGLKIVPKRHSIILFVDAPHVDYGVTPADTLPQLYASNGTERLERTA